MHYTTASDIDTLIVINKNTTTVTRTIFTITPADTLTASNEPTRNVYYTHEGVTCQMLLYFYLQTHLLVQACLSLSMYLLGLEKLCFTYSRLS